VGDHYEEHYRKLSYTTLSRHEADAALSSVMTCYRLLSPAAPVAFNLQDRRWHVSNSTGGRLVAEVGPGAYGVG
jgi:hypothetical protein